LLIDLDRLQIEKPSTPLALFDSLPDVDHYRNLLSLNGMPKHRPTLFELQVSIFMYKESNQDHTYNIFSKLFLRITR
jgi:hypothetical protein